MKRRRPQFLLAHDFSPSAERALETATRLAEGADADLWILHVLENAEESGYTFLAPNPGPETPGFDRDVEHARVRLESIAVRTRTRADIRVSTLFGRGVASEQILHVAEDLDADLLLMGTGHTVLESAPCPVISVGATTRAMDMEPRILYATDFSDAAMDALTSVVKTSRWLNARVLVFHMADFGRPDKISELLARGHRIARFLRGMRIQATACVRQGAPARGVLMEARELPADLIVLGAARPHRLRWGPFGGETHRIVRAADCPVLVDAPTPSGRPRLTVPERYPEVRQ